LNCKRSPAKPVQPKGVLTNSSASGAYRALPQLVYIHIEVQSQHKTKFASLTFIYYYRIFDNYQKPVVTLVIFGDESSKWQPTEYWRELWGCELNFKYPSLKLNDYETRLEELAQSDNPFAVVVQAHLHTKATKRRADRRIETDIGFSQKVPRARC